ncbi:DUF1638 domain-containing protein [Geobacter sp. AOG2]|uniref:DUF1638 domain-containing protein n=1 Tax=Geobacter sp. AOG2 TaxID=1566347 RepID=UPI001CC70C29|nr:DUF1638 domain-containing protein [Geobacter sp. AOG2]GFE62754.1 hypothetical protein AOG2_33420 [Geobacter sp. AOG2]
MTAPRNIIGCGILKREIRFLAEKNGWRLETAFLPSGLHVDFDRLESGLERCLSLHAAEPSIVFYGACHPRMDQILETARVARTPGQNCVEIYLGHDMFCRELEQGAFFLFEDWALHWREIVGGVMPGDPEIMRSIFRTAHTYLLAIRTPCSGDFSAEAEAVSAMTSLELRWVDVGLEHLEAILAATLVPRAVDSNP